MQKVDSVFGTDQFNYDPIGRITGQTDPERKYKSYLYDPAGDLLKTKAQSNNENWSRAGEYEGVSYRFDRVGNLVERAGKQDKTEFIWDANGRLVESVSDGKKTIYQYDPLGRRISKETDGVVTRFYWDGDALLGDVTGDDTREWVYYPGSFEPLAMVRNEEFYLYHNEPNGCPSRLLDESGKVVWAARYDAWGKVKKLLVDEVEQPLRLQGQYFDRETGLYYNRFRYYCAEIGAFISQDPLGLVAGENVYAFGLNAQGWIDPLGLCKNYVNGPAHNAANYEKLKTHLRLAEKYGKGGTKELPDGRKRYYGELTKAKKPGEMAGRRLVREWDPKNGNIRTWHETLDHTGKIRQVRPETGGAKVHYQFNKDGDYIGKW